MSELIATISKLSVSERILLIQEILDTISAESEEELTASQKAEIDRRSDSIEQGKVKTVSWDSIEANLIKRYELQSRTTSVC